MIYIPQELIENEVVLLNMPVKDTSKFRECLPILCISALVNLPQRLL